MTLCWPKDLKNDDKEMCKGQLIITLISTTWKDNVKIVSTGVLLRSSSQIDIVETYGINHDAYLIILKTVIRVIAINTRALCTLWL